MAINLSAVQTSIRDLFFNNKQYIIPEFQRPYSWGNEQCYQFYKDLTNAFAKDEDYFLGNIILATSERDKDSPQIIDGQQRMITLWILLKVLSIYVENIDLEGTVLQLKSWKKGEASRPKVASTVEYQQDGDNIKKLLAYKASDFENRKSATLDSKNQDIREDKSESQIEYVSLMLFHWISQDDITNEDKENFVDYLLDHVYMLPIEMGGSSIEEAREKALTIFETINNRGMDLQDADIFKARIYRNAMAKHEENLFMSRWNSLMERVMLLNTNIDEVFRCYYHIIRGQIGKTNSESKLRDFFLNDKNSPMTYMNHSEIMDNLHRVVDSMERLNLYNNDNSEVAGWIQVLNVYSNIFPRYALIAYLFKYSEPQATHFLQYVKSIARYVYYFGSTTSIKFGIYNIIQRMSQDFPLEHYYRSDFQISDLSSSSRLLNGLSLIAYYQAGNATIKHPVIEKFVYESEVSEASRTTEFSGFDYDMVYALANYIVLEKSVRGQKASVRLKTIAARPYMMNFLKGAILDRSNYDARKSKIEELLIMFFKGNE